MWSAIRRLLGGDEVGTPAATPVEEARVCAATLLVEAALSDGIYADIESETIRTIIATSFSVDAGTAERILHEAETRADQAIDHHRFTNVVKRLPLAERERLVENLWAVVFADGEEAPEEQAIVRKFADLLHVDPRASRLARRNASGATPS